MGKSKRSIRSTIYAMKLANQMAWRANKQHLCCILLSRWLWREKLIFRYHLQNILSMPPMILRVSPSRSDK